eukprot:jgi/Ulvmu1/4015/UM188_0005.1
MSGISVYIKEHGGNLWLQDSHARERVVKETAVRRSAYLSRIQAAAEVGETYSLAIDWRMVRLWLSCVEAADKLMAHLSSQQLAAALQAADWLADMQTLREVCAAQRQRIVAIAQDTPYRPHCLALLSASTVDVDALLRYDSNHDTLHAQQDADASWPAPILVSTVEDAQDACGGAARAERPIKFNGARFGPLRWFERLILDLTPDIVWTLLYQTLGARCTGHAGTFLEDWLFALPPRLRQTALHACMPSIEQRGVVSAEVRSDRMAQLLSSVLTQHQGLEEACIRFVPQDAEADVVTDDGLEGVVAAVCAAPTLRTLQLSMHDSGVGLARLAAVVRHLPAVTGLRRLTLDGVRLKSFDKFPGVSQAIAPSRLMSMLSATPHAFEAALRQMQHLTELSVVGVRPAGMVGGVLARCVSALTMLRELHVVDSASEADTAAVARAAAELPRLALLRCGAVRDGGGGSARGAAGLCVRRLYRRSTRTCAAAGQQSAVDSDHGAGDADGPAALTDGDHTAGSPQLELSAVEVLRGDAQFDPSAAAAEIDRAPTLRSIRLDTAHPHPTLVMDLPPTHTSGSAFLQTIAQHAARLTELHLSGSHLQSALVSRGLAAEVARMPQLQTLRIEGLRVPKYMTQHQEHNLIDAVTGLLHALSGACASLLSLSVHAWGITRASAATRQYMHALARLTALTSLHTGIAWELSGDALADADVAAAMQGCLAGLHTLRQLDFTAPESAAGAVLLRLPRAVTRLRLRLSQLSTSDLEEPQLRPIVFEIEDALACKFEQRPYVKGGVCERALEGECAVMAHSQPCGALAVRVLHLDVFFGDYELTIQEIDAAARLWERQPESGPSQLLNSVFMHGDHAKWLESLGEFDRTVHGMRDRLVVVVS